MKRIYLFCGVGCVIALFAVTAFSQGSKPTSPCCESAQDAKATPCCEKQAVAGKPCCQTVEYAVKATPCCCNAAAKKDTSCASSCCCAVTVKATAHTTKQANVYDLLEKLEALKAKQDALESEVRETRALLNEKFRTLQERVVKTNMMHHGSPYSPVITTYGVPLTAPSVYVPAQPATTAVTSPYPCVPPQPCTPGQEVACPATPYAVPLTAARPAKATKADRPGSVKPVTESSSKEKPKKPDPAPTRTPVQPTPSLPDSLDDSSN